MAEIIKVVDPGGTGDYLSIAAWEAAEQGLHISGDIVIADCIRTTSAVEDTTTALQIRDWTAGVEPRIIVRPEYRHEGNLDVDINSKGNYIYKFIYRWTGSAITARQDKTVIDGLYIIHHGTTTFAGPAISVPTNDSPSGCIISNNLCQSFMQGQSSEAQDGISLTSTDNTFTNQVFNNIVVGWEANGIKCTFGLHDVYNNTIIGNGLGNGILSSGSVANTTAKNNIFFNYPTSFSGLYLAGSDYNATDDALGPGVNAIDNITSSEFKDYAAGDYHLAETSQLIEAGVDLSATNPLMKDMDGQPRPAGKAWDIGADYYVPNNEMIWSLRASGGDFNNPNTTGIRDSISSDLTAIDSIVFSHNGITGTLNVGNTVTGLTSGSTGIITGPVTATQIYLTSVIGAFQSGETIEVTPGNSVVLNNFGSHPILVIEGYNDWPTGFTGVVRVNSSTTSVDNYHIIRAAPNHGHTGVVKDASGNFTGFAFDTQQSNFPCIQPSDNAFLTVENVIMQNSANANFGGSGINATHNQNLGLLTCRNNIFYKCIRYPLRSVRRAVVENCIAIRCGYGTEFDDDGSFYASNVNTMEFSNCISIEPEGHGFDHAGNNGPAIKNCIVMNSVDVPYRDINNYATSSNNAASNVSDFIPGTDSLSVNVTKDDFVDYDNDDFRLSPHSKLRAKGINLYSTFTDSLSGAERPITGAYDIGSDQYLDVAPPVYRLVNGSIVDVNFEGQRLINGSLVQGASVTSDLVVIGNADAEIRKLDLFGGIRIFLTLRYDNWVSDGASFDAVRQDIINSITSTWNSSTGWNAVIRDSIPITSVIRHTDKVVIIEVPETTLYDDSVSETIKVNIPTNAIQTSLINSKTITDIVTIPERIATTHGGPLGNNKMIMPELLIPNRKPAIAEIDWTHPMTDGLKFCYADGTLRDMIRNNMPGSFNGVDYEVSQNNLRFNIDWAEAVYGVIPELEGGNVTNLTIASSFNYYDRAGSGAIISNRPTAGSWSYNLAHSIDGNITGGVHAGNSTRNITGLTATDVNKDYVACLVKRESELEIYLNGEADYVTPSAASGSVTQTNQPLLFGRYINSFATFRGSIYWGMGWNRALSRAEIKSLNDNPYQFLKPRGT